MKILAAPRLIQAGVFDAMIHWFQVLKNITTVATYSMRV